MDIESIRERFEAKFVRGAEDECWIWMAAKNQAGYGMIAARQFGEQLAHRVAYRLQFGDIPTGMAVCHTCDNRPCVNPFHFFVGTIQDNNADMVAKGRNYIPPMKIRPPKVPLTRDNNPLARFSTVDVEDMLRRYTLGETQASIAARYSARQPVISKIIRAHCTIDPNSRRAQGLRNINGKLTPEQIGEIRGLVAAGISQEKVARRFGLSQASVSSIIRRETYAYVS